MKIAISTATYFADAILGLLIDAGYDVNGAYGDSPCIMVNTTKLTAKDGNGPGDRQLLCPATQWAAIAALVNATDGGAQVPAANHTRYFDAVALPTPAAINPMDAAGNLLAIGDTVLVVTPVHSKPLFNLRTNGVAVITRITAKGALGFAFDADNEFLSKRFQKVTVKELEYNIYSDDDYNDLRELRNLQSGDLVVARPGRHQSSEANASKFALPTDTALVFRGVTVNKGNFILDGYADHKYSPARFSVVTPVFA